MEIIKITQLPMVEDLLEKQGEKIKQELAHVESLACTEDNKKEVKKIRTAYGVELKTFEEQFKTAISELEEPVKRLKLAFKEHIQTPYKNADTALKEKISIIETTQKEEKENEVKAYFDEYKISVENGLIDFVGFKHCILSVGLSDSLKSLKTKVKDTLDKIVSETNSIATMEDKDVILLEYTNHLDFAKAVSDNAERKQRLAEQQELLEKSRLAEEERKRQLEEKAKAEKPVEPIQAPVEVKQEPVEVKQEPVKPPVQTEIEPPSDPVLQANFRVTAPKSKLIALKKFMLENGIKVESI